MLIDGASVGLGQLLRPVAAKARVCGGGHLPSCVLFFSFSFFLPPPPQFEDKDRHTSQVEGIFGWAGSLSTRNCRATAGDGRSERGKRKSGASLFALLSLSHCLASFKAFQASAERWEAGMGKGRDMVGKRPLGCMVSQFSGGLLSC